MDLPKTMSSEAPSAEKQLAVIIWPFIFIVNSNILAVFVLSGKSSSSSFKSSVFAKSHSLSEINIAKKFDFAPYVLNMLCVFHIYIVHTT